MKSITVLSNDTSGSTTPLFKLTLTEDEFLVLEEYEKDAFRRFSPKGPENTVKSNVKKVFGVVGTYSGYGTYSSVKYDNTDFEELREWANSVKGIAKVPASPEKEKIQKSAHNLFSRFFDR